MKRIAVESSSISSVGYQRGSRVLEIEYRGGRVYQYLGVPPAVHRALMHADSKGRFVNFVIKPRFPYIPS